ncbi:hypothetical protein NE237_002238 [Protea cynaroides]|uniref:Uncharacterized protein n=1 Tax=Protea cynaroides TaxID=273540 RepID=A0A9Q0KUW2_9MAGN|nr:hypothetical protein NE237_002238 [Protea cynaroides]
MYMSALEVTKSSMRTTIVRLGFPEPTVAVIANATVALSVTMATQLVWTPIDVVSQRLMVESNVGIPNNANVSPFKYHGGINAFRKILNVDGLRGLYKGFGFQSFKGKTAVFQNYSLDFERRALLLHVWDWVVLVDSAFFSLWPLQEDHILLAPLSGCGIIMTGSYFLIVWFSCFQARTICHTSKKTVQLSAEATDRTSQEYSHDQVLKASSIPTNLNLLLLESYADNPSNTTAKQVKNSSSVGCCSKSEEINSGLSTEGDIEVHQMVHLKKSRSMESGLNREDKVFIRFDAEDEIYQASTGDDSHLMNSSAMFDIVDHGVPMKESFDKKSQGINLLNQCHEALITKSIQGNCVPAHNESIVSIEDPKQLESGHEDFVTQLSGELCTDSGHSTSTTPAIIAKSHSFPDMGVCTPHSVEGSSSPVYSDAQNAKREEFVNHEAGSYALAEQEKDNISENEKDKCENLFGDGYDSFGFIGPEKDWTTEERDGVHLVKKLQEEPSVQKWNELPTNDFKIKRIEEWVSMINLQDSSPFEETSEPAHSTNEIKKSSTALDSKNTPGIEVGKSYISSLTATSTSAQLGNLGLVVIPFLSAFVSLRVLNLSGNAIVRITAGALPRGLHVLNLSKNNISIIEGLRELTRLRILDLSYNRIFKIGHGLAYCSSLKELYLAGNKISEVEGLHRLLKLNILDLRFNKISTAKSLDQLAANYSSLQAISLEGNPAQRNVGDEQLKKYLQGLLPNLVYLNRHPSKANSSKEVAPARPALNVHKFDGGLRSELKPTRKGSHSVASHKPSSSSHGRTSRGGGSPNQSKNRPGNLPPIRTKGTTDAHYLDLDMKLKNLRSGLPMHRSRSVGNLGAP